MTHISPYCEHYGVALCGEPLDPVVMDWISPAEYEKADCLKCQSQIRFAVELGGKGQNVQEVARFLGLSEYVVERLLAELRARIPTLPITFPKRR